MRKTVTPQDLTLHVKIYREPDGRWLADIAALPGVTAYGLSKKHAMASVQALVLRLIADRLDHGEAVPGIASSSRIISITDISIA